MGKMISIKYINLIGKRKKKRKPAKGLQIKVLSKLCELNIQWVTKTNVVNTAKKDVLKPSRLSTINLIQN